MSASPTFQHALGLAVKHRREELGLTQEQLDNDTDLHQRWISNVERGRGEGGLHSAGLIHRNGGCPPPAPPSASARSSGR